MNHSELTRRRLLAATGVGVAAATLSACAGENPGTSDTGADPARDNFGEDPNGASTTERAQFNPRFMSLIHLTSNGRWGIASNDAHFQFEQPGYDKAARTRWACEIFANKIAKGLKRFSDEPRGSRFQVYDRTPAAPTPDFADELEFARFGFGQPHDLYVFFEHGPGELSLDGSNRRLVDFSRELLDGKPANPNHAFFNAEVVTDPALLGALAGRGSLFRLDNLCTVKDSKGYHQLPYGNIKSQKYKLDIFYKAASGIAMAIDPEPGNGQGYDP